MHHLLDEKGDAALPREDAPARALEPARRDQGELRRRERTASPSSADRSGSWSGSSTSRSRGRRRQPARRLEPVHERGEAGRRRSDADEGGRAARRREADQRAASPTRATRCCCTTFQAARRRRSVLADRADAHRARASTRTGRSPRRACARCSRRSSPRRSCRASRRSIEKRLGRPLEPFDIWYNGFRPRGTYTEAELDAIIRKRYPTAEAYKKDIPNLLVKLGFTKERARVPRRQHRRRPRARLRPRAGRRAARRQAAPAHARRQGRHGLQGLQHRRPRDGPQRRADLLAERHRLTRSCRACRTPRSPRRWRSCSRPTTSSCSASPSPTRRAARCRRSTTSGARTRSPGVALVDMAVWHWMYDHPNATPAQLKDATLQISKDVWNKYYAPVFKKTRRGAPRRLRAHGQQLPLPAQLPDRPPDRVPDRGADGEGRQPRRRSSSAWRRPAASRPTSG